MAGAGYKLFNSGDVLTAAQVNTYLMEQTVMVFNDAAARTTALSGVLSEGMISYLKDTNAVEVYNGSAWVASDDPNAIQNTIVDAKGDLITATAADTPARLASSGVNGDVLTVDTSTATGLKWAAAAASSPLTTKGDLYTYSTTNARLGVGANGETLVADSSQTTGLRYNPPVGSLANPIINGGFDVWQRGTSISVAATAQAYTADRWVTNTGTNQAVTVSRQTTGDTTNLPNIQYCLRYQRNSGQTGTNDLSIIQPMETANSLPLAGKIITVSFYARAGANFSATNSLLYYLIRTGTGTDQNPYNAYTGGNTSLTGSVTLTTTWQRFAATVTIPTSATEIAPQFYFTPVGTASTNDWYEITGVQIDLGTWTASTAPTFRRSGGTLAGELAACQRYYYLHASGNQVAICLFTNYSASEAFGYVSFPVTMRTAPTLTMASGTNFYAFERNGGTDFINAATIGYAGVNTCRLLNSTEISGTAGQAGILKNDNASSSVAFSAEL